MRWLWYGVCFVCVSFILFTCSQQKPQICGPGSTQSCLCVGGLSGVQSCDTDGTSWLSCVCSSPTSEQPPDGGAGENPEIPKEPVVATENPADEHPDTPKVPEEHPDASCQHGTVVSCYSGKSETSGVGECRSGQKTCNQGVWGTCVGEVIPGLEICDGKDNDCNGTVDDHAEKVGTSCQVQGQVGPCAESRLVCEKGMLRCLQTVQPQAKEVCGNSVDDDCNGKVDDECTCSTYQMEPSFQIYPHPDTQIFPVLLWNGTSYGVIWDDAKSIYFTEVSANGTRQGLIHNIAKGSNVQSFLNVGTEYVAFAARLERGGQNRPGITKFLSSGMLTALEHVGGGSSPSASTHRSIAWTGQEFLRGHISSRTMYIQRLDASGKNKGTHTIQGIASYQAFAWNGNEIGLVFGDYKPYFLRLTPTLVNIGASISLSTTNAREASVIWNGKEYGVVWRSQDSTTLYTELYFQTVSATGTVSQEKNTTIRMNGWSVGTQPPSTELIRPQYSIVWGNGEYGISYQLAERVYFARISASGGLLGQPVLVSDTKSDGSHITWTGKEYAIVWYHQGATDKVSQIYMRRLICK